LRSSSGQIALGKDDVTKRFRVWKWNIFRRDPDVRRP
jgi:hypothetical protein